MSIAQELRQITPDPSVSDDQWWQLFHKVIPPATMDEVLDSTDSREKRNRKLPAKVMLMLTIAMNIFTEESLPDVYSTMTEGIRFQYPEFDDELPKKGLYVRPDIDLELLQ